MSIPIEAQIVAVETALQRTGGSEELAAALATLRWVRDNRETIIAARQLLRHPAIEAIRETFPDAELVDDDD